MPPPCGGQLGVGPDDAAGDHGAHQVALPRGARRDELRKAEFTQGAPDGGNSAVGAGGEDLDAAGGVDEGLSLQVPLEKGDGDIVEMGEIGEGAFLDLAVLAVGLAQELGGVDLAPLP